MSSHAMGGATGLLVLALGLSLGGCDLEKTMAKRMQPGEEIGESSLPPAPDYSDGASWAARPDAPNKGSFVPEGVDAQPGPHPVDVFYIHPTTYYGDEYWNPPIDEVASQEWVNEILLPGQGAAFNACCRLFAPRYRQASLGTYLGDMEAHLGAFDVAFGDLSRAFETFLEETGDRPFIIASHSQGSLHAMGLLETLDTSPERERLVAAYVVGHRLTMDRFGENYQNIKPCAEPLDTGCIAAWDTYSEDAEVERGSRYPTFNKGKATTTTGGKTLCVNPITWKMDGAKSEKSAHLGEVWGVYSVPPPRGLKAFSGEPSGVTMESLSAPKSGMISARCDDDGILRIPTLEGDEYKGTSFTPGNYHILDYRLFFMDIRANAIARSDAYLKAHSSPESSPESSPQSIE